MPINHSGFYRILAVLPPMGMDSLALEVCIMERLDFVDRPGKKISCYFLLLPVNCGHTITRIINTECCGHAYFEHRLPNIDD